MRGGTGIRKQENQRGFFKTDSLLSRLGGLKPHMDSFLPVSHPSSGPGSLERPVQKPREGLTSVGRYGLAQPRPAQDTGVHIILPSSCSLDCCP